MAEALSGSIFTAVVRAIRRAVCLPGTPIASETRFAEDLLLDSLNIVEITMELEETFQTELPMDAITGFRSVSDVVAYFSRRYFPDAQELALLRAA